MVWGVPRWWSASQFAETLTEQGWKCDDDCKPTFKFGRWSIKAIAPKEGQQGFVYNLDNDNYITVRRWRKSRQLSQEPVKLTGPKWFGHVSPAGSDLKSHRVGETQLDPTGDEEVTETEDGASKWKLDKTQVEGPVKKNQG